ncbi:MAG: TolC family protein, partial [Acidobacteriota bacterium]
GGRRSAAVESAAAQAAALGHRLEQLDRSIRLEVTARHLDVETARSAVDVAESGVIAARENLDVASDRHREGLIPSSERLDAEVQLLRAGLDRATALARLRVAQAQLARALGN